MSIIATDKGGGFNPIPEGTYFARCVQMFHLGTRKEDFGGNPKIVNKVHIDFEVPTELVGEEGEQTPRIVGLDHSLSMNSQANLRKMLESWRGGKFSDEDAKEFDVAVLIGIPAMITVIHKKAKASGNTYTQITNVAVPPEGTKVDDQITASLEFNFPALIKDPELFGKVPGFLRKKIRESEEYAAACKENSKIAEFAATLEDEKQDQAPVPEGAPAPEQPAAEGEVKKPAF